MEKRKLKWIGIGVGIIIVVVCLLFLVLNTRTKNDNSAFELNSNLVAEVYSNITVKDFIKTIDGKVLENKAIDTKKLGKQEIQFLYLNSKNKKRRGTFSIEIKDTEKPLVWLSNRYSVKVGSNINLEEAIMCADNYDNNPSCKVVGDYDVNTPGNYNLSYIATDSSKNTNKIDFILNVYEPVETTSTSNQEAAKSVTAFQEVIETHKNDQTEIGIDVSKWQKEVDFAKVKQAGASFVMLRVGSQKGIHGEYILDPYFEKNIENALVNNLKVGVYFYSYADSIKEAKKQAKWVIKHIEKYDVELPIAFDWECYNSFNQMELSLFNLNEIAESFLKEVEKKEYKGILYGSKNYLNDIWKYHSYDVWLAHYTKNTDYEGDYIFWQLCENGQIDGIDTPVDINVWYKNEKQ